MSVLSARALISGAVVVLVWGSSGRLADAQQSTPASSRRPPAPPTQPAVPPPTTNRPDATTIPVQLPGAVAPGGRLVVRAPPVVPDGTRVQEFRRGAWISRGNMLFGSKPMAAFRAPLRLGRLRLRLLTPSGASTVSRYVQVRNLTLAAVGDINLGDGPGAAIDQHGAAWPWQSVGPVLRRADIAFGNLECAVSMGGVAQPKTYTFRGRPSSVTAMRTAGGIDVVNLANNHAGDFGDNALLDTLRHLRANEIASVGAGASAASAYRPTIVERLGLRIAFVGFSEILPFDFRATESSPGTAWAFPAHVRDGVRRARREADIVIATFHWGIERDVAGAASQHALAQIAFDAGATAVIGAHPHVLQPIRKVGEHRLIAYSLGNFVFSAHSPGTQNTGILNLSFSGRGVEGTSFRRARIVGSRPVLSP